MRKYQCRNCHKCSHFSSLCYNKRESFEKRRSLESRPPKAHQLQIGQVYMQDNSICGQSGDVTSSDESLFLQVKVQCPEADTKFPTPHHLITDFEYRLKPHHKKKIPESLIRYMCQCKHHACQCLQVSVPGTRL